MYCTVLYCTVLHCTVLYCTVLYCTVLYCTVLYCNVLYCTVLYCTTLYSSVNYLAMRLSLDTETHCEEQERAWKMMSSITTIRYFLSARTQRVQAETESLNYMYVCVSAVISSSSSRTSNTRQ